MQWPLKSNYFRPGPVCEGGGRLRLSLSKKIVTMTMRDDNMKSLVMLIFIACTFANCERKMAQFRTEAQIVNRESNSAPDEVSCDVEGYKPKSVAELQAMSPRELVDERVKSNPWDSFDSYFAGAEYERSIEELIRKAGIKALPVISEYFESYDHNNRSECTEVRFAIVSRLASDIDRFDFRLRGTKEGQSAIDSLERALQRIMIAEPGLSFINGSEGRHQPGAFIVLKELKGINGADRHIADTFWVCYKIKLSENELLEFTNYLISRDRKYPAWSESKLIKDYSRINEAGNPSQVYIFDKPKPYYDAYLDFKKYLRP